MRRSPLQRGAPLQRKTPLLNKKPLKAKSAPKARRASTGPARDVVDAVLERAGFVCELGGCSVGPERGVDHHIHHRRPRAMGGTDRPDTNLPSNLLLLCPTHHAWVESRRTDALSVGWLVAQSDDPALIPVVVIHCPRPVYLTAGGRYSIYPPRSRQEGDT